jgi:tripartite-type tricarboxylate transporter receptor subunit TctC
MLWLKSTVLLASLAAVFPLGAEALAQAWPDRQITIVVPFAAGGSTDTTARMVANHLGATLKQTVIVENKPGAGGDLGAAYVANASPEGYTFLFGTTGPLVISQFTGGANVFDPQKAFTPVIAIARAPNAVIVNTKLGVTDLKGLIALAKSKPNGLSYASPGAMTTGNFAGEWLKKQSGANLTHVPYRGSGPAVSDLLAGVVEMAVDSPVSYSPHVESGNFRILAVTTKDRFSALPDVPSMSESGLDMNISVWFALVGPAGVPKPIVDRLNQEINVFLGFPETRAQLAKFGAEPMGGSPQVLADLIRDESARWEVMVTETGIKP